MTRSSRTTIRKRRPRRSSYTPKTCSVCHETYPIFDRDTGQKNFNGSVCASCFNERRRERYQYDPRYRLARKRHARKAYDKDKHREYMRAYRARKKQTQDD